MLDKQSSPTNRQRFYTLLSEITSLGIRVLINSGKSNTYHIIKFTDDKNFMFIILYRPSGNFFELRTMPNKTLFSVEEAKFKKIRQLVPNKCRPRTNEILEEFLKQIQRIKQESRNGI